VSVSTAQVFQDYTPEKTAHRPDTDAVISALANGDLHGAAQSAANCLTGICSVPDVGDIIRVLIRRGALGASMSGSGPTVFGLFENRSAAESAAAELRGTYREVSVTEPVQPFF
jgi:4-diphosphocytidyl-2-C-methyl-D-erythritol kinase